MLEQKYEALKQSLQALGDVVIAFSGGVDSTLLLKVALDTLGRDRVLAVTADSETYPREELLAAQRLAAELVARHEVISTSELAIAGYADNSPNRCYFCKKNLFVNILPLMELQGYHHLAFGLIADDMGEHRPGVKVAREYHLRAPLQEADLYKPEIRELALHLGLSNWDKPSYACLSSRVVYGEEITLVKLRRIEESERYIRSLGIRQVRVRVHGDMARIEVEPEAMPLLLAQHDAVSWRLRELGFKWVAMDLGGYQSGSMNRILVTQGEAGVAE
ncbi:ATP-dependent sacrificial sulfur transferase LarE [Sodalis sp. dw_96]|uniref:ATP-dependent sacrificial sulfur transferase LarE n=1 Tax=Sodalis sp. dw_96 TaxID=2719794 RepID=UPI001BD5CAD5|nr:ATP-dependent sacrificial sulfur transferase LarE [Sodalis sp. dw_96]